MTSAEAPICSDGVRRHELLLLHQGELPPERTQVLAGHLAHCGGCRSRIELLETEEREFLSRIDLGGESAAVLSKLEAPRSLGSYVPRWFPASASLAAVAAGVALFFASADPADRGYPTTRLKGGGPGLEMFVKTQAGIDLAPEGIELSAGDQIQFRYQAGGRRNLYIVSVDGRLVISSLYPAEPKQSVAVEPDGRHVLDGSIILDDALGPERVLGFFSDRPLSFEELRPKIEAALERHQNKIDGPFEVGLSKDGVEQVSILFHKVAP